MTNLFIVPTTPSTLFRLLLIKQLYQLEAQADGMYHVKFVYLYMYCTIFGTTECSFSLEMLNNRLERKVKAIER